MAEAGGTGPTDPAADPALDPAAPDPAASVRAALDRLAPAGALGIAVSGGGDSMALLAIAADWARQCNRELQAVTVDHGLRSESAAEAEFAGAFAARIGVSHHVLRAGPMPPGNLPAAAREARYALMAEWAEGAGLAGVALGHTVDDQAETVLMRLARGSGIEGLSGMAPRRDWRGIAWIRPMLAIRRAELRAWLRAHDIAWIDDPTNKDARYDRVKARRALALLQPLGVTVEGLAGTARTLARQRRVLVRAAAELDVAAISPGAFGEARISLAALREAERDTALRVFAETLVRVAGRHYRPRFRALEPALEGLLGASPGATTLGGCLVLPDAGGASVLVCREPASVAGPMPLAADIVWDGRWRVTSPGIMAGWRIGALGEAGCDHLGRAAREGAWQPAALWSAAPRAVRETVPALFSVADDATDGPARPVAVPPAAFVAAGAPLALREVGARLAVGPDAAG